MAGRQSLVVSVRVDPAYVERGQRLFEMLLGVPIPPARKERMLLAALEGGVSIGGRPWYGLSAPGDLEAER